MIVVDWVPVSRMKYKCQIGNYTFYKIVTGRGDRYEVWVGEELEDNTLTYFEVLKCVDKVRRGIKLVFFKS